MKIAPQCRETEMKITKRQLKRIIREEYTRLQRQGFLQEYGAPGMGGQGNDSLGSERAYSKRIPSGRRGFGWSDFQALAQDGDYAGAGQWLQEYCRDRGHMCNREMENHMISMAQDEYISGQELQEELLALLEHFSNGSLQESALNEETFYIDSEGDTVRAGDSMSGNAFIEQQFKELQSKTVQTKKLKDWAVSMTKQKYEESELRLANAAKRFEEVDEVDKLFIITDKVRDTVEQSGGQTSWEDAYEKMFPLFLEGFVQRAHELYAVFMRNTFYEPAEGNSFKGGKNPKQVVPSDEDIAKNAQQVYKIWSTLVKNNWVGSDNLYLKIREIVSGLEDGDNFEDEQDQKKCRQAFLGMHSVIKQLNDMLDDDMLMKAAKQTDEYKNLVKTAKELQDKKDQESKTIMGKLKSFFGMGESEWHSGDIVAENTQTNLLKTEVESSGVIEESINAERWRTLAGLD